MSATLDITDVPVVAAAELALAMRFLEGRRQSLLAAAGPAEAALRAAEQTFWQGVSGDPQRKLAVMLRLRCLVVLLSNRRMQELAGLYGLTLVPRALEIAAAHRLNAKFGFNPQKFLGALRPALADSDAGAA